jgi:hypothetical protein
MKTLPPLPGEEALYKMIQLVLDAAAKDPQIKAVLTGTPRGLGDQADQAAL